jgi:predicted PhzF superfamily epimerase YddE/YHI9
MFQVHLCGHATLATAHVLFTEVGATAPALTFSTLSGDLVVEKADAAADADPKSPLLRMDFPQGKPQPTRLSDHLLAQTLAALGLADADLVWREPTAGADADADAAVRAPVTLVCPVTKKLFVEIVSVDKLVSLKPNADALLALPFEAAGLPVRGVCVMVQGGRDDRSRRPGLNLAFYTDMSYVPDHVPYDFVTRYFAPWNGIYEDPVNGSSHTALAVIWSQEVRTTRHDTTHAWTDLCLVVCSQQQLGKKRLRSFQASARTGELEVALAPNDRTLIFGHAVTVMGGRLRV